MAFYAPAPDLSSARLLASSFAYCPAARFTGVLRPAFFLAVAGSLTFASSCTWDFSLTLWTWLSQSLSANQTCTSVVARAMAVCHLLGRVICSPCTGAFCKARAKLAAAAVAQLAADLGHAIHDNVPLGWQWRGRAVKSVDGSLLRLTDTPQNLAVYPLQKSQKAGTTFTRLRLVCLFCLATGALLGCAYAAYKGKGTGELSLLLQLLSHLRRQDILLGDRSYGNYPLLAALRQKGIDGCFRLPVSWQKHFGEGQCLGEDDYLQTWSKPRRSKNTAASFWDALPGALVVRVLRFTVSRTGFRTRAVYVVTTLTDHVAYRKEDIAELYLQRWTVEVDIRTLKTTLPLGTLRCKTPELVAAELWTHLLGYNLVRCSMAQAAWDTNRQPRQLSFTLALNLLNEFRWLLVSARHDADTMRQLLSTAMSSVLVGKRAGRYEPREVKHRERKYPPLKKDRRTRRAELPQEHQRAHEEEQAGKKKTKKGAGKDRPGQR